MVLRLYLVLCNIKYKYMALFETWEADLFFPILLQAS